MPRGARSRASINRVHADENSAITRTRDPLDDTNWFIWRDRMTFMLKMCGVDDHVKGRVDCPDPHTDPAGAENWAFSDGYAKMLITNNVTVGQMVHIGQCVNAREMWSTLEAAHGSTDYFTELSYMRILSYTRAKEGDNICDLLDLLKLYWDRIHLMGHEDLNYSDEFLCIFIANSLPPSWAEFIDSYVGGPSGIVNNDPERLIPSQQLIRIVKDEYIRRKTEKHGIGAIPLHQVASSLGLKSTSPRQIQMRRVR
jgi:hypothetical protein